MYKTLMGLPFVIACSGAMAHHSFAMFDNNKEIIVTGTVSEFQWTNPHTWIEMEVADQSGQTKHWSIEGGSVIGLSREGWNRNTVRPGDKVTLVAHPLRDGTPGGSLMGITLPDGRHLGESLTPDTPAK
jgi:Family of unknown function (DUF6152)